MNSVKYIKSTLGFEGLILSPKVESLLKDFDNNKMNETELIESIVLLTQQQLNKM